MFEFAGKWVAGYLQKTLPDFNPSTTSTNPVLLARTLQPGDVLLVEGDRRISVAIKYLTRSNWSHAALYIGDAASEDPSDPNCLLEADPVDGVTTVPLHKYTHLSTRICRPVNLTDEDRAKLIEFVTSRIGMKYDIKNVVDLLRYLLPQPPIPVRWRRRMLALGSGDPTRAICSTLIAHAFQSIRYPILPKVSYVDGRTSRDEVRELLHIRHHSLYTPRDFDLSPYFRIIKPTIESGFNYKNLRWGDQRDDKP